MLKEKNRERKTTTQNTIVLKKHDKIHKTGKKSNRVPVGLL